MSTSKPVHTSRDNRGVLEETFSYHSWFISTTKCHILNSKCITPFICDPTRATLQQEQQTEHRTGDEGTSDGGTPHKTLAELTTLKRNLLTSHQDRLCDFCKFDLILAMSHFPDMTYSRNMLRMVHEPSQLVFEFNPLDALFPVIYKSIGLPKGMKVAPSEAWLKTRMNCEYTRNVMNAAFDWTFSSDYRGTLRIGKGQLTKEVDGKVVKLAPTEADFVDVQDESLSKLIVRNVPDRINTDKLRQHDVIHFFDEIDLFEDELADHGTAKSSVKIRVMQDCFFVLLRFFLRVDNVFVRYYDTRFYHEFNTDFVLREFCHREGTITELDLSEDTKMALLVNPVELFYKVPEKVLQVDKFMLQKEQIPLGDV